MGDIYTSASTILAPPSPSGGGWYSIDPNGGAVLAQMFYGEPNLESNTDEQELFAGASGIIPRAATGVRFRNAVKGTNAIVTAWLAPTEEPAFQVSAIGTSAGGVTFLGRFTQAQWPPATVADGNIAYLVDTNNNAAWLLTYTAATNLWTPYNGDPASYGIFEQNGVSGVSIVAGATRNYGSFILGVAGSWSLTVASGAGTNQNANISSYHAYLGTTASANDILDAQSILANNPLNQAPNTISYTATKGQSIFVGAHNSDNANTIWVPELVVRFRPVSLANA